MNTMQTMSYQIEELENGTFAVSEADSPFAAGTGTYATLTEAKDAVGAPASHEWEDGADEDGTRYLGTIRFNR
jgi:hypothetical protein